MNSNSRAWILAFLITAVGMIAFSNDAYAFDIQVMTDTESLPYHETITLDIDGVVNTSVNISYDNWLSGQSMIIFEDPLHQLDVNVSIPNNTPANNYTRTVFIEGNSTENRIISIVIEEALADHDEDGYTEDVDCDDSDPTVNPGAEEIYYNGKDDDCDPGTSDEFLFWLQLNKQKCGISQDMRLTISAINGSNVTIEICEEGEGFVPCYYPIILPGENYPQTLTIPYTNETGTYIITGTMQYNQHSSTKELQYSVSNTLSVVIEGESTVDIDESFVLAASASGGLSPYSYEWSIPGRDILTAPTINISFPTSGTKQINLTITDEAGNTFEEEYPVNVRPVHQVKVYVKDYLTENPLHKAEISFRDSEKVSNKRGLAIFQIPEGTHSISVIRTGFELYTGRHTVDEDMNITIFLEMKDEDDPIIKLVTPQNNTRIEPGLNTFEYRTNDISHLDCELYMTDTNSSFFLRMNSSVHNKSGLHQVLNTVETGDYRWKVECEDSQGNVGMSHTGFFRVRPPEKALVAQTIREDDPNLLQAFLDALDRKDRFDQKQQEAASYLNFETNIKKGMKNIDRFNRDLADIVQRRDITEDEKDVKRQEVIDRIDELYYTVPVDIQVNSEAKYVKYMDEEQLTAFLQSYYEGDYSLNRMVDYMQKLQQKIGYSVSAFQLTLYFVDGSTKEITLIAKQLEMANLTKSESLMEIISEDLANENELVWITDGKKVGDGVYEFEDPEEVLVYYIEKKMELKDTEKMYTLLMNKKLTPDALPATGHGIFEIDVAGSARGMLIMLIALAVLGYIFYSSDGMDHVKRLLGSSNDKQVHYVRVLANDVVDNALVGNIDKANMIFTELKLAYEDMGVDDQDAVQEAVDKAVSAQDIAYIRDIMERCKDFVAHSETDLAVDEFNKIQAVFDSLKPEEQHEVYDGLIEVHNLIQHSITEGGSAR